MKALVRCGAKYKANGILAERVFWDYHLYHPETYSSAVVKF